MPFGPFGLHFFHHFDLFLQLFGFLCKLGPSAKNPRNMSNGKYWKTRFQTPSQGSLVLFDKVTAQRRHKFKNSGKKFWDEGCIEKRM